MLKTKNNESIFDIWIIHLTLSSSPRHSALNRGRSICSINLSWFLCPDSIACNSSVRFLWNSILWFLYMCSLCVKGGSSYTGLGNKFGPRSPFNTRSSCWKNKVSISSLILIRFHYYRLCILYNVRLIRVLTCFAAWSKNVCTWSCPNVSLPSFPARYQASSNHSKLLASVPAL